MPEFILDKEGTVNGVDFEDFDAFVQGYIEAMFFTNQSYIPMCEFFEPENQELIEQGQADGELPNDAGFSDLHPDALNCIHTDCRAFQQDARVLLSQAYARDYDATQAGRDFWFTRNGHGVGFWDREVLDDREDASNLGRALSAVAEKYGQWDVWFQADETSPTGYGYVRGYFE